MAGSIEFDDSKHWGLFDKFMDQISEKEQTDERSKRIRETRANPCR